MDKDKLKIIIGIVISIGLLVFLFATRGSDLGQLTQVSIVDALLLSLIGIIPIFFNAQVFRFTMYLFGLKLDLLYWLGLPIVNTLYNYILPAKGGTVIRSVFMKRNFRLKYIDYAGFMMASSLTGIMAAALVFIITSFIIIESVDALHKNILILMSSVLILGFGFLLLIGRTENLQLRIIDRLPKRFANAFNHVREGMRLFYQSPRPIIQLLALQVFFTISIALRLFFSYYALGVSIDFLSVLNVAGLIGASLVFSITPGNLGIKEGVITASAGLLGIGPDIALLGALLDRAVALGLTLLLGIPLNIAFTVKLK